MTTRDETPDSAVGGVPVERYPDGETPPMTELAQALRPLVGPGGLDHLVFYDGDVPKLSLAASAARRVPDAGRPAGPELHESFGQQLYYVLQDLRPDLEALRTGALIRTVLRVPDGAVFYYLVEPGFHLYGATPRPERIEVLDEAIADAVNRIRTGVRYSELDFGAYLSRRAEPGAAALTSTGPLALVPDRGEGAEAAPGTADPGPDPLARHLFRQAIGAHGAPPALPAELPGALALDGLHYVAYHDGGSGAAVADILDHPALGRFFRGPAPAQRRERYRRMSELLPGLVRRVNGTLRAVMRGEVLRLVLDVEQGALYFHALGGRRFLIGVTLDQSRVAAADETMGGLGAALGAPGGPGAPGAPDGGPSAGPA
jgi:hypothetical protein